MFVDNYENRKWLTFETVFRRYYDSEYINSQVAELLDKLRIEFTKSRSRHSNDNALAEGKNAAVVRKQFGYSHIPQRWAPQINQFNRQHLNPYLNFHRPCFFSEARTNAKGKELKIYHYENLMTPTTNSNHYPTPKTI